MLNTLRSIIERNKQHYLKPDGSVTPLWYEEGCVWAIQDYHSIKGSLSDFTDDDFMVANEEGWPRYLIEDLCRKDEDR